LHVSGIAERKIMDIVRRQKGLNVKGFVGLLQPLADCLKIFEKEANLPRISIELFFGCAFINFCC
jgi:NADH:ubiquinone oxidoreductase subunit H